MENNLLDYVSNLNYEYQKNLLSKISNSLDLKDEDCMDDIYRLSYNLFIDNQHLELLSVLLNLIEIDNIDKKSNVWPYVLNILFLKIIVSNNIEEKQKILDFIVRGGEPNNNLIESRFNKVINGVLVDLAKRKINEKLKDTDVNLYYAFGVSLLTKQIQKNLYEFYGNLSDFEISNEVEISLIKLKEVISKISNLEGA